MILKSHAWGVKVKLLQQLLNIKDDGFFGFTTLNKVKDFQKQNDLKVDGVVGPKTWEVLLKDTPVNINPVYKEEFEEDFSDPEEEMIVGEFKEAEPTCKHIGELIAYINSYKITRKITRVVFHCTATSQSATVSSIRDYWKKVLGWNNPGYHIIVTPDGSWTLLQEFNKIANGVAGINKDSIHISYIGGILSSGKAVDNRTSKQKQIFETIYFTLKNKLPGVTFHGHNEFSNKACPSYNVKQDLIKLNQKLA